MINAYYLLVDYEEVSRYITVRAINTGGGKGEGREGEGKGKRVEN